ncbi:MAG: divalent-cation tolerance protein CutA [Candidatus Omnitrophota bacterium]
MNIVIFITAKNKKEAVKICQALLKKKLIACANVIDSVESFFWWQGKIDRAKETLCVLKSKKRLLKEITQTVKSLHSYDVPEVIALPIIGGHKPYLDWVNQSVQ